MFNIYFVGCWNKCWMSVTWRVHFKTNFQYKNQRIQCIMKNIILKILDYYWKVNVGWVHMEGWFLSQFSKWQLKDKIRHEKHCLKNTWLIITTCVGWVESIFNLVLKMHQEKCHFKSTWLMVGTIVGCISNGRLV
jgi:hypothetical protein